MASTDPQPKTDDRLIARLARNIGWLLSGQGVTGLFSLIYLAVAARSLGPKPFGIFMVVLTYAQLFANIIQFQSWKGVIRFGALHLSAGDRERLSRLLGFTAVLDWSSALGGAALAAAGAFAAPVSCRVQPETSDARLTSVTITRCRAMSTPLRYPASGLYGLPLWPVQRRYNPRRGWLTEELK